MDLTLLQEAAEVWAPDFPRHASNRYSYQQEVADEIELYSSLTEAGNNGMPGYVSTYSFPNGHSKSGNVPKIDTIFVDFDIRGKRYNPDEGRTRQKYWRIELSDLLARVRMFSRKLVESGEAQYWRASLSGHKGVHLFLDFPTVEPSVGSFLQFKTGLREYADNMTESLEEVCGGLNIEPWVDVISADLGRMVRHPNTPHHGVEYTDEVRYCVPVSIKELTAVDVDRYIELTSEPRSVPEGCTRCESSSAGEKVEQTIRRAKENVASDVSPSCSASEYDSERVREYMEDSNDSIEVEDLKLLTRDKPSIWAFRENEEAFQHGMESRMMELFIMLDFINLHRVPIDVIVEFFRPIPGFNEHYTESLAKDLIARGYNPMSISKVRKGAGRFFHSEKY